MISNHTSTVTLDNGDKLYIKLITYMCTILATYKFVQNHTSIDKVDLGFVPRSSKPAANARSW